MGLERLLNQTATVLRKAEVPDGIGGFQDTWSEVGQAKVRLSPVRGQKLILYQQAGFRVTHTAYAPGNADIRPGDRLQLGPRLFHVESVLNPSEMGHHLEVLCWEAVQ